MNNRFVKWILILLALLLVGGGAYLYTTQTSLRQLFSGVSGNTGESVGKVEFVDGQLKRQPSEALEFINAPVGSSVYNEDTVITGEMDSAKIRLFDGTLIELGPGSLVRLAFESSLSLAGIQRKVLVDVVSGSIKAPQNNTNTKVIVRNRNPAPAQPTPPTETTPETIPPPVATPSVAAEPSPEPTPEPTPLPLMNGLRFTSPRKGSTLALSSGQQPPLRTSISFVSPEVPDAQVLLVIEDSQKREVLRQPVTASGGQGTVTAQFDRPGTYSVMLLHPTGEPIRDGVQSDFKISPDYRAIEVRTPLIAGEEIDSNVFRGKRLKDFDVTLRWKDVEGATQYRVKVTNASGTQLLNQTTTEAKFDFPKSKVYSEPIFYQILSPMPSGFVAASARQEFLFNFLSPQLTLPKSGSTVSVAKAFTGKRSGVLFTWQRTSFTLSYDFEIAADPGFNQILKKVNLKENFVVFRNLKPGAYYWRVRSLSSSRKSPPGAAFKLNVTP